MAKGYHNKFYLFLNSLKNNTKLGRAKYNQYSLKMLNYSRISGQIKVETTKKVY